MRRLARKVFNRVLHGRMSDAFYRLADAADQRELEERRRKAVTVLCRITGRSVRGGFNAWRSWVVDAKREEAVVKRFARRLFLRNANACFLRWREMTEERRRVRRIMKRMLDGKDFAFLEESFRTWKDGVRDRSFDEIRNLLAEKTDLVEKLTARLELLEARSAENAMSTAKRMVQMWTNKCLTNVMEAWKGWTRSEKEDRVKMERFVRKWKNMGANRCFLAWQSCVQEGKRNRFVIKKFLKKGFYIFINDVS